MAQIIFVTGTDTGVGKTLITALLLQHWRERGFDVLAMKPLCTGDRSDVELFQAIQGDRLELHEANPFFFHPPLTPMVAARLAKKTVRVSDVLKCIERVARCCEWLLVEGAGGLLSPLGEGFSAADLIAKLRCEVVVVASNKLGAINHTLLTVKALEPLRPRSIKVVFSQPQQRDRSAASNASVVLELTRKIAVENVPFLGARRCTPAGIRRAKKKIKKVLARILDFATFSPSRSRRVLRTRQQQK